MSAQHHAEREHSREPQPGPGAETGRAVTQSRYGGPEVLELTQELRPEPGPGHVRVRVHAASVNARDWHVTCGEPRLARLMMIWVAVFPTLTVLNLTIGPWLSDSGMVLRTFVLATIAVPIVIYGLMPRLHRIRALILTRRTI